MSDTPNPNGSQKLSRVLVPFGTLMIIMSLISPASSFFVIVSNIYTISGTGAILSFAMAGLVALCLAFVWSELASAYPVSGGEYTLIGKTLGRFLGFLTLGLLLFSYVFATALWARSIGDYLSVAIPVNSMAVAIIAIIVATIIGVLNIKMSALVTGIFLGIELLLLLLIVVVGFIHPYHSLTSIIAHPIMLNDTKTALTPAPWSLVFSGISVALFAVYGYGSATAFGEEIPQARKKVAKIILLALIFAVTAELLPCIAVVLGSPNLVALFNAPQIVAFYLETHLGHTMGIVANVVIALTIFNAMLALLLTLSRQIFSSGRDNIWFLPVLNKSLAAVHSKFSSPYSATIAVCILTLLSCFLSISFLLVSTATALVMICLFLCFAAIAGRLNGSTQIGYYRMPLYPLPPLIAMCVLIYVLYSNWLDTALGRPSLIWTGIFLLISTVYYVIFLSWRKNWELLAPTEND